jgi:hypothetical protein
MAGNALPAEVASHYLHLNLDSSVVAQQNFATINKELDLDYIEGHRIISLPEALGAREVQAKVTPGGPSQA